MGPVASSPTSRPSCIETVRRAASPIAASWVTRTIVRPAWLSELSSAISACPVCVSSAPVGSSARIRDGSLTSARAIATRCCSPPDSWLGQWSDAVFEPNECQHLGRPVAALPSRHPGIHEREGDVLERRAARKQIVALKDEAEVAASEIGPRIGMEAARFLAGKAVGPRARLIKKTEQVHQGGFARSRGADDRHELPVVDLEGHVAQRGNSKAFGAKLPSEVAGLYQGLGHALRLREGEPAAMARQAARLCPG